jgi:hypothetical protein
LIILELSHHILKLLRSLLQVLLVNLKFLSNLWPALLSQDVLKFDIKLFFFLNKNIFLADFFSLGNQTLLEGLNFLDQLIGFGVCALKFPPAMHVKWLL